MLYFYMCVSELYYINSIMLRCKNKQKLTMCTKIRMNNNKQQY